ncbi:hypothetical protein J6397_29405 [Rhodococcus qingshengii]|uniref:hypothetical protein n=1 Tax=Rhodococcus TaxID=1827 RepID=UPI00071812CA|nr:MULTISPECIES: hypothetical protein [Rhodococcus]MBP1054274.1 hypothetical protein [Rhodococcus qingshengii]MBP2521073.1 hypothetical protein [Rhodococcus sp. PvP104]MDA3637766.1 hypothetical protein [Rhodococcus sp. C-2]MYV31828.1 hypothetical protein [Rhodococcus erythropolis]
MSPVGKHRSGDRDRCRTDQADCPAVPGQVGGEHGVAVLGDSLGKSPNSSNSHHEGKDREREKKPR